MTLLTSISSSATRIDELQIPSNNGSLSRTSTWEDDAITIVPSESRKGSLPRSETAVTAIDEEYTRSKEQSVHVECRTVEGDSTKEDAKSSGRPWWHPVSLFWLLLENWFLLGMPIFITLAWAFPEVGREGGLIRAEHTVNYGAIALIFLITGLTLSTQALYHQIRNWYSHLFTQSFSLLFFPAVMFAIVNIIKAADDPLIDPYILVGLMMMAILPTTVAANVTMTREAEGNEEAAIAECCIGQVLGIFFSPLLLQIFMSSPGWEYGVPVASGGKSSSEGLKEIYKQVGRHMGLAIFLPMFVGQIIQNISPKQTKWTTTTFRLPKVGSFLLLILIWSIFCEQFDQNAFNLVHPASIILVVFLNLTIYLVFTALCVFLTRLPFLPPTLVQSGGGRIPKWRKIALAARFPKPEATAICFCAAAKGLVVGSPILDILYGGLPAPQRAIISIPLVLYQGEQIACGQLLTYLFRRWNRQGDPLFMESKEGDASIDRREV